MPPPYNAVFNRFGGLVKGMAAIKASDGIAQRSTSRRVGSAPARRATTKAAMQPRNTTIDSKPATGLSASPSPPARPQASSIPTGMLTAAATTANPAITPSRAPDRDPPSTARTTNPR